METLLEQLDRTLLAAGVPETWPAYATRTFACLSLGCLSLALVSQASSAAAEVRSEHQAQLPAFRWFQATYLVVYLITMLADWLQGTTMYTLYQGYNMPIGTLFLTGFTSSAVFGTFLGLYVDKYGRRLGCIIFCILEIIINTLEHYPNFHLLMFGRVLGGVSTSLLFSAFESWMVTEHRRRKFPDEWLASTHALASTGNGLMAIMAGVMAQVATDAFGDIGPFKLAIGLTVLCLVLVLVWTENYGEQGTVEHSTLSLAWREIWTKPTVSLLGLIQALYEGAMFSFVFMWVPTILRVAPADPPLGLLFSCFMVCVTLGGMISSPLMAWFSVEWATVLLCAVSAITMLVPVWSSDFYFIFGSFLVVEACVGCWFACSATLRSKYLPESLQSSIMTIFRVPLNILVVIGTKMEETAAPETVFYTCAAWFGLSSLFQVALTLVVQSTAKNEKKD